MEPAMDEARVRDFLRVLRPIPIERGRLVLYRLAVEHGDAGFTSTTIKQLLNLDQAAHCGLMAALRQWEPQDAMGLQGVGAVPVVPGGGQAALRGVVAGMLGVETSAARASWTPAGCGS